MRDWLCFCFRCRNKKQVERLEQALKDTQRRMDAAQQKLRDAGLLDA